MPKKKKNPTCPDDEIEMVKQANGTWKCSECGAVFIPSSLMGIFVPLSFIGIH